MNIKIISISLILYLSFALPRDDQIALANSLIVGRDGLDELYNWNCKVCDTSNKPLHAHIIEEK